MSKVESLYTSYSHIQQSAVGELMIKPVVQSQCPCKPELAGQLPKLTGHVDD